MTDVLIHDFGVLPKGVRIWNGGPTRTNIEVQVRFPVELWRVDGVYELRHSHCKFAFSGDIKKPEILLIWQSPAKGPGNSRIAIGDVNSTLLDGGYENLDWMRTMARKLARLLETPFIEDDRGSDC